MPIGSDRTTLRRSLLLIGLAIAFWCGSETTRAIGILKQALQGLEPSVESDHPVRRDLLSTFAEILAAQGQLERAAGVYREVLGLSCRRSGEGPRQFPRHKG